MAVGVVGQFDLEGNDVFIARQKDKNTASAISPILISAGHNNKNKKIHNN